MFVFVVSIVIGGLVLWQALGMPPAFYEPLGPATFPFWLSIFLIALGTADLVAWLRRRRTSEAEPAMAATEVDMPARPGMPRLWVPLAVAVATAVYVAAIDFFEVSFPIATAIYVFAASAPFSSRKPVELGAMAVGAILFGYAIYYLFTEVLFIDI